MNVSVEDVPENLPNLPFVQKVVTGENGQVVGSIIISSTGSELDITGVSSEETRPEPPAPQPGPSTQVTVSLSG